mgnify:CR=1 FL=1
MKNNELSTVFRAIVERLRPLGVSRIVVFGSTAWGERRDADSDIDLAVVVDSPREFRSYDERLETKSRLRVALLDINETVPIDILLYTEEEFGRLSTEPSFVGSEVVGKGQTLYEKAG